MTINTTAEYTVHLKVTATLEVCPCIKRTACDSCSDVPVEQWPKSGDSCYPECDNCHGTGMIPQPYNGPAVEAYGDTYNEALNAAQELLQEQSWATVQVMAIERQGEMPMPMQWMDWVLTNEALD